MEAKPKASEESKPLEYRCYLCGKPSDGLLCQQCRDEIDRGEMDRVVRLANPDQDQ